MTSKARHRPTTSRRPPSSCRRRSEEGRGGAHSPLSHASATLFRACFQALGIVLLFVSCLVLFVALVAAATLDIWTGAFGGVLSVVTAVVGYSLVCRWLP